MATYGLDLSQHNGSLDFNAIKSAGNDFVILRAGYGWGASQKDPNFEAYYSAAKAAGLKVGAYHYSYARNDSEARAEADIFLSWIKGKQFEMPVYIDMEDADGWKRNNGNPSGAAQASVANVFMQRVQDAGYYVGIYASSSWFNGYLTGLSTAYTRWIANWGTNNGTVQGTYKPMHQYTSNYSLGGKRFDRNICYEDFTSAIKTAGLNGFPKGSASTPVAPAQPAAKQPDQVLSIDSKVTFEPQLKVDGIKGDWIHCNTVTPDPDRYLPAGPLKETTAADGKCDQILHIGAEFTYPGTYTVGALSKDKYGQWIAYLKEIDCWVRPACLIEVAEGR